VGGVPEFLIANTQIEIHRTSKKEESKAILITGSGSLECCAMLRIPHYLENRLTDGSEVSFKHQQRFPPQKLFKSYIWYSYLLEAEKTLGPSASGKIRQIDKRQMPKRLACSIVAQPPK
jgi:hypothetical protein